MNDHYNSTQITNSEERLFDLWYILHIFSKRWKMILALIAAFTSIALIYAQFFTTPLYQASTLLFVYRNNNSPNTLYNEMHIGTQLAKDIAIILKSRSVAEQALKHLGDPKGITPQQLLQKTKAFIEKDTRLLRVSVQDQNPQEAARIANTITEVLMTTFGRLMESKIKDVEFLSIVEEAIPNPSPVSPNKKLIVLSTLLLTLFAGSGIAFLLEYLDNTIKSPDEAKLHFGGDLIVIVPTFHY